MTTIKSWKYPQTDVVKRFEELFNIIEGQGRYINKWYHSNSDTFIYENSKFYYHMAVLRHNRLGFYFDDYVCNRKGELVYNTTYGYFKTKEAVKDFLEKKTA